MNTPRPDPDRPAILYGAAVLAVLSLAWSAYAITDLMDSGKFGLSVALAGDIGWITVLWAEYKGVRIAGHRWPAAAAGWLIAAGVTVLLVIHGAEYSRAQAIAGPFVVLVGKIVWLFALAALKDPTALTPEQEAEIHAVMRDSEHTARLSHARTDAAIAHIRDQARTVLARDEADFEIYLERLDKQAEIRRRTPLAIAPGSPQASFDQVAEQAVEVTQEAPSGRPDGYPDEKPDTSGRQDAETDAEDEEPDEKPLTSTDKKPDSPDPLSIIATAATGPAQLVRALAAHGVPHPDLVSEAVRLRPDMVADSIRRTAKRLGEGPYL